MFASLNPKDSAFLTTKMKRMLKAHWTYSPAHYWLGAPLFGDDRIIGLVAVQSYDVQEAITKEDEHALNAICPYIATAISQTELLSRIKRI